MTIPAIAVARTWSFVVPRGDWVDAYSTTNGRIILGMRLAAVYVAFCLALIAGALVLSVTLHKPIDKDTWDLVKFVLELLAYFIGALAAVSVAQFASKRMTADPAIVKAESEAKLAAAVAPGTVTTTTSVSSSSAPPAGAPLAPAAGSGTAPPPPAFP